MTSQLEHTEPPAAVLTSAQLKMFLLIMGVLVAGSMAWATWVTVTINDTKETVAVIESNRYTPKDRLEDMKTEVARYDQINTRVDQVFDRLSAIEGDMKELKAVLLRMEAAVQELARKGNP